MGWGGEILGECFGGDHDQVPLLHETQSKNPLSSGVLSKSENPKNNRRMMTVVGFHTWYLEHLEIPDRLLRDSLIWFLCQDHETYMSSHC